MAELDHAVEFARRNAGPAPTAPTPVPEPEEQGFSLSRMVLDVVGPLARNALSGPFAGTPGPLNLATAQVVTPEKRERLMQNAVAEAASIPGAVPGIAGIVEGVTRAGVDTFVLNKPTDNLLIRSIASDSGRKVLDIGLDPTVDPQVAAMVLSTFNPETDINWGLRNAARW